MRWELVPSDRFTCKALTGPMVGLWRLRVGDYWVIIDVRRGELTLVALYLGHQSTVYE